MKTRKRHVNWIFLIIALAVAITGIRLAMRRSASAGVDSSGTGSAAASTAQNEIPAVSLSPGEDISEDTGGDAVFPETSGSADAVPESLSADEGTSSEYADHADPNVEEHEYDHVATELENGRAYLISLEERTPVEMEYMIEEAKKEYRKQVERETYSKKREEYRESLSGDKVWEAFDDYVFLGDSRVVGFDVFGFLSSRRILAGAGDTINSITDNISEVKDLSPKYIFISYGINDIGMGYWPTAQEYADAFSKQLHALQKELPDAEIYVNSIIPARDDAVQVSPIWAGLPEYSEAVRAMCAKEGISFIDNGAVLQEHADLYASDGVHMQSGFYRYWAENQLLGIFDRENGHLTF